MNECYFVINKEFQIIYIKDTFLYKEITEKSLIGKNIYDLNPEIKGSVFEVKYKEAFLEEQAKFFYAIYPGINKVTDVKIFPNKKDGTLNVYLRDMSEGEYSFLPSILLKCVNSLSDMIVITEALEKNKNAAKIIYANDSFLNIMGFKLNEVIGKTTKILDGPETQKDISYYIHKCLESWIPVKTEIIQYTKKGDKKWISLDVSPVADNHGKYTHWIAIQRDITQEKQSEEKIKSLAFYDQLTNLPNRHFFNLEMDDILKNQNHNAALLFMDLDNFKTLNDTMGHSKGDLLLKEITDRLHKVFSEHDFISRFGGDEFVIIVKNLSTNKIEAMRQISKKILKLLKTIQIPFPITGYRYIPSASIGLTLIEKNKKSKDELMLEADLAMYHAKEKGKNSYSVFIPALKEKVKDRQEIEKELQDSLKKNDELVLFFQPQFKDDKVVGAEALIRWKNPNRGFMEPFKFIPYALEAGLISNLDYYVIERGCKFLSEWSNNLFTKDLSLSINLTAHTFIKEDFIEKVSGFFNKYEFKRNKLKFEITENFFLETNNEVLEKMIYFKDLGVRFSLDDFGTGYSSLSYLRKFPIDEIKIDREFVIYALNNKKDRIIIQTIIEMARKLELSVLAEGVETVEQKDFLRENGCFVYQGFFYAKPLQEERFFDFLLKNNHD